MSLKLPETAIQIFFADIDQPIDSEDEIISWLIDLAISHERSVAQIEYVFCSDAYLLDINKTHLDHDTLTDIITFPLQESPLEATIYISLERIRENADLYQASEKDELHRVMAHGLLHLLGYNDKTDDDKETMRSAENKALAKRSFV